MKRIAHIFLIVWLLIITPLYGEDVTPDIPDPATLASDWWLYFEPREALPDAEQQERLDKTDQFYVELRQRLAKSGKALQVTKLDKVLDELKRFHELKNASDPVPQPATPAPDTYTIATALQAFDQYMSLEQGIESEDEEIAWLSTVQKERRKLQSRLRGKYLEMDAQSPQRLDEGLNLMQRRLALERLRLEVEQRKTTLQHEQVRLERLKSVLEKIGERLKSSTDERQQWEKTLIEAEQAAKKLREEIDRLAAREAPTLASSPDLSGTLYRALSSVRRDIEVSTHDLNASRARNTLNLIDLVGEDSKWTPESIRTAADEFMVLDEAARDNLERWRSVIERVQDRLVEPDAAAALPADASNERRIRDELEKASQLLRQHLRERTTGEFVIGLVNDRLTAREGWVKQNLINLSDSLLKTGSLARELLSATLFEINETPVTSSGLLRVVLILVIALWLSRIVRRAIQHIGERRTGWNQSSLYTFGRLLHYLILVIVIITGLSTIGIDFTKFALFASALGVGIGFGLQTLISNFVAGLIILFEKSLKVGDFVELESGVTGEVKEINMRSTLITTNDNIDILVPNSEFVGGRVINWTLREAYRRIRVPFGVAYGPTRNACTRQYSRQPKMWNGRYKPARRANRRSGLSNSAIAASISNWLSGLHRMQSSAQARSWPPIYGKSRPSSMNTASRSPSRSATCTCSAPLACATMLPWACWVTPKRDKAQAYP